MTRIAPIVLLFVTGCALGGGPRDESTPSGFRTVRVGNIALAGQPSPEQIGELGAMGYRTVVTLRASSEIAWDEGRAASQHSLRFAQVPVRIEAVEVGVLARVRSILEHSPGPVLLHCASGNCAALVWAMLEAGKRPDDEIIATARRAGLSSAQVPKLQDYLADHAAGKGRLR